MDKHLLNARFTIQKQAEEITELRAEVIKLNAMLNRERAGKQLQEVIDRAWAHLDFGHVAIARNILAAHISQPKYQRRIT